jgi:glyoxylase-like metal-dependent hydrolase (beta-lactamase superfamily II)
MGTSPGLDGPVSIGDGVYWVGTGTRSFLARNSYLRVFRGAGTEAALLLDPGPTSDLEILEGKLRSLLGDVARVNMVFVNHQDPDVVGALPLLAARLPHALFVASDDTWRLVSLNGLAGRPFRAVERFRTRRVSLPTGHRLEFVPTPFCHFRGACMLYDLESRVLFTGDLFGGVAASGLLATPDSWAGIRAFHQLYMPSNEALRLAVQRIRRLDPAPVALAPQHGGLVTGDLIGDFLRRMEELPVGLDILVPLERKLPALVEALNEIVRLMRETLGADAVARVLGWFRPDGSYPAFFSVSADGRVTGVKGDPLESTESLLRAFLRQADEAQRAALRPRLLQVLVARDLPAFDTLVDAPAAPALELAEA